MKKKLLAGCLLLTCLLCIPFFQLNSSSDFIQPQPVNSAPEPIAPSEAVSITEPAPLEEPTLENFTIFSSVGILTYFNQNDPRWAKSIYGGSDPIDAYGCGPTALAMLVSSFTGQYMTPADMAYWAASNNYWVEGSGSKNSLIPEGAAAFGFQVESLQDFTSDGVKSALKSGHILVALVGPGHFTDSGHFIIIADYWSGNQVRVADPANFENSKIPWDIDLILSEIDGSSAYGGPVWVITPN